MTRVAKPVVALDARLISSRSTGDTSYWRGLIGGLLHYESEFELLLISNAPRPDWIPERSWLHVPGRNRWWSLVRFPLAARAAGASVVHTQYSLSPLVGNRGIVTIHDVSFLIGPEWFRPKDRFLLRRTVPASARRAAAIVAVSERCKSEIERFLPMARGKVVAIPNALGDNIRPMPLELARQRVRAMGIQGPYLLSVGTLWPRKNTRLAIRAADLLPDELPHKLVLTGKAGWGPAENGARVFRTGYVSDEDLTALYQCADLYLAPSLHEGFGIPVLEAFACRCPVLASSGGALPEVVADAGAIEPSFRAEDWALRIRSLLADSSKLEQMREAGLVRLKDFDWRVSARQTLDLYLRHA